MGRAGRGSIADNWEERTNERTNERTKEGNKSEAEKLTAVKRRTKGNKQFVKALNAVSHHHQPIIQAIIIILSAASARTSRLLLIRLFK